MSKDVTVFWRKKDKGTNSEVKMFFASDLHGSNVCFKKFVNSAKFYGVDVLVLGGDLTGKAVIPIAEQEDGTFVALQHGESVQISDKDELDEFVKRQGNMGFYPAAMAESEYQRLKASGELAKRLVEAPSAPMMLGSKILGFTLITFGLILLVFVMRGWIGSMLAG